MPTVAQALAASRLDATDAAVLLAHVLSRSRTWLVAHAGDVLTDADRSAFAVLAERRLAGEPVAYLTGVREFHGLPLAVSPAVLIPRPDTETLVDFALSRLPDDAASHVLDLATGSGAIALAIAKARPRVRVLAVDISPEALAVARGNARRLAIANVEFVVSDWFSAIGATTFDCIVANPPYVAAGDPHLDQGDLRFEPVSALSPGGDGLGALRRIVAGAGAHLATGATLAVEHGYDQGGAVARLFDGAGFRDVSGFPDLAGNDRVTAGTWR